MGTETRARLALAVLLGATLLSFKLVFENGSFAGPTVLGCVVALAISALARRWGAGPILTLELSLAALFWYLTILFEAGRSFYGLPTPAAATGLVRLVSSAVEASAVDFAPVPVRAGYVIMIVFGFWLATTIGEIATFRLRRPLIAAVPPIGLAALTLIAGTGDGAVFYLALFLIALFTFWAAESSYRMRTWGRWVSPWKDRKAEPRVTGALARRMGISCIAVTLVAPMFLPSLGEGWLPWRNDTGDGPGDGEGGGGEINLLVDIAPKLLEQSDTVLLTVEADEAAYWRLTSLADFDGRLWHPLEVEREPLTAFEDLPHPPGPTKPVTQIVNIEGLEGDFLPAAVQPIRTDEGAQVDSESYDLRAEIPLDDDRNYTVTSLIPDPTFNQLQGASIAEEPSDEYLETGKVTSEVEALLEEWTAGADTPFEELLALQTNLRSSDFLYNENVEPDEESDDYLGDFLIRNQQGFCQQFATAFAVLARKLGYPSRVSVGFLPGEEERTCPACESTFTVRGTDAHAWPEVKFEDYGWIPFEPTPRGPESPPRYTLDPTTQVLDDFKTGGTSSGSQGPAPDDPTAPRAGRPNERPEPRREITAPKPVPEPPWQDAFVRLLVTLSLGLVAWGVIVPAVKRGRIKGRYRRARTPADVTIAAFRQLEDDASEMSLARRPAESAPVYAERLEDTGRVPALKAARLARLYEAAAYSPEGVTDQEARDAKRIAGQLSSVLWARATLWEKARKTFSIRSLIAGRRPSLRPRQARTA